MILTLVMVPGHSPVAASEGRVVDLILLPSAQTVNVGETFDITIEARCHGQEITGVAAFLDFDPAYLEVVSITPGATLDILLLNIWDNAVGTVDYSAGTFSRPFPTGTFAVATIEFRAKAAIHTTAISFHHDFPRVTDADFGGTSKLDEAIGATVTIIGIQHTLTMTVVGGGTTEPAVGAHTFAANTVVDITATPAAGWEFSHWVGDVADTTDPTTTVTMDADKSVTAHFDEEVVPGVVPPEVVSVSPEDGAIDVAVDTNISVTFSEEMDKALTEKAFSIEPAIRGSFRWVGNTVTFEPEVDLEYGTIYTVTILTEAKDLAGNPLVLDYSVSFTTLAAPLNWALIGGITGAVVVIVGLLIFLVIRKRKAGVREVEPPRAS